MRHCSECKYENLDCDYEPCNTCVLRIDNPSWEPKVRTECFKKEPTEPTESHVNDATHYYGVESDIVEKIKANHQATPNVYTIYQAAMRAKDEQDELIGKIKKINPKFDAWLDISIGEDCYMYKDVELGKYSQGLNHSLKILLVKLCDEFIHSAIGEVKDE